MVPPNTRNALFFLYFFLHLPQAFQLALPGGSGPPSWLQDPLASSTALTAGSMALPTGSSALIACSETLQAGSRALPAGSKRYYAEEYGGVVRR